MLEKEFLDFGYTKEEYELIRNTYPINGLKEEKLLTKFKDINEFFLGLGYTKEEVIKMTKSSPSIYGFSIETLKQKIEALQNLGYSKEEVIKMTKSLPSIYDFSIENMRQKIEFYNSINMHNIAVEDPKVLMQSTALSYARYRFYQSKGITINMGNYIKLFMASKQFEKSYGITKEELLKKYDYKKFMEENGNART